MTEQVSPVATSQVLTVRVVPQLSIDDHLDLVAVEQPLLIRLQWTENDTFRERDLYVTMRTPGHDFELAKGFLLAEAIAGSYEDIVLIRYCKTTKTEERGNVLIVRLARAPGKNLDLGDRNFLTTSSCGVCGKSSIESVFCKLPKLPTDVPAVDVSVFFKLKNYLNEEQTAFKYTGGMHAAVLFDLQGSGLLLREDVGRHNALDKLVGAAFDQGLLHEHRILLLSGRVSFELVQKAAMAQIWYIAAFGAPSTLAIELAEQCGITLVGFLTDHRLNCYTHRERIKGVGGKIN